MRHGLKRHIDVITPHEAIKLVGECKVSDITIACDIYDACDEEGQSLKLATIWNAGRVQGIRQERARRKQREVSRDGKY